MLERSIGLAIASASLLGCASDSLSSDAAVATVTSASGLLTVTARTLDERPPSRGANPFDIEIARVDDGTAVEGLELTVVPWMPAMGHGASARPVVSDAGAGHYLAENVHLFMPGLWELRVSLSGPIRDDAAPRFQVR
jgi:hypothetical protein